VLRVLLLTVIAATLAASLVLGLGEMASPDHLRHAATELQEWVAAHAILAPLAFLAIHTLCAGLSLPLNIPIAVAAGALFGLGQGVLIAVAGAGIGSTLAMLSSRWILRDWVERRFARRLAGLQNALRGNDAAVLLSLRLMPAMPYTLVNLLFGLTQMKPARFAGLSMIGMVPAKLVFVQAGTSLASLHSFADILSWRSAAALVLLATVPLISRRLDAALRRRAAIPTGKSPPPAPPSS